MQQTEKTPKTLPKFDPLFFVFLLTDDSRKPVWFYEIVLGIDQYVFLSRADTDY